MVVLRKGDYVWVDCSDGVQIGAEVRLSDTGQLQLIDDEGKEHKIKKESTLKPMHPTSVNGVDDMIRLGDLNEAGLLRNLLVRYKEGAIYTYTGSILVAVNPYQLLPIYTPEQVEQYTDRRLGDLPPHVFAIADSCFFNMRRNRKDQCCIISGESGAGKTESTKLMLQFLAAVSGQRTWIEQQILEANPILEAFGNAKTIRNDNSSRFGKYIDIHFNKSGAIEGARIEQYLLEKSRVCRQASQERNYHIFYCMLMGMPADQKKILSLGNAAEYNYLTMGKCTSCEGRDDINEYASFRSAMKILTFTENDTWEINKLLASILHLGNVDFEETIMNNLEGCDILSSTHFKMATQLLEVAPNALDASLTQRSLMTNRESVTKPLTSAQALDGRDAFVKAIYGRLFVWIVAKINSAIYKPPSDDPKHVRHSIGLLDIFGFENFKNNSFEQLCINFANEQLQQFFVKHVFKLEQQEYAREDIVWKNIEFNDNQSTLDVLAIKSLNILALIDEESRFPKGTDVTMLNKMNQHHGKGDIYICPKNNHDTQFGIRHFAGVVHYDSKGFLEKNRDALSSDIIQLIHTSSNKLLKQIFHSEISTVEGKTSTNHTIVTPKSSLRQTADTKKQVPTLTGQFRQSLDSLMKTLTACQPFFIRCIKPNDFKKPMLFDRELCIRQLRYSGMMETIRIRKAGYPIRHTFDEFLERYRVLLKSTVCDPQTETVKKCCESICKIVLTEDDWKIGKTKVFLKDFHDTVLELARDKALNEKALLIQKVLRGYKHRKAFLRKRGAAVTIQKTWRGHKGRKLYRVVQLGYARLQAQVRSRKMAWQYKQKRKAALLLQSQTRGCLARKEWKRKRDAVILLQAYTRGTLARKAVNKMKRDAFLSLQERRAEELAALERQRRLEEVLRQKREREAAQQLESITDQEMVDDIFGFLPSMVGGQEGQAPVGFEDLEGKRTVLEEVDLDDAPMMPIPEEDYDDLDEYSFSKFASMYFQGAATPTHIRQRLRQPLLYHEDENDVLASLTVWWMILRFMGDLPEPKAQVVSRSGVAFADRSVQKDVASRQDRRLSHMVGVDQRIRNSRIVQNSPTVPEEASRNRKSSTFTDLLSRSRKSVQDDGIPNRKLSAIPEQGPRNRKTSTFTDIMSRNRKTSTAEGPPSTRRSARKPSVIAEEAEDGSEVPRQSTVQTISEEDEMNADGLTLDRPMTSLEKLHIIVGYAIVRRDLRDEIYCQICKQLQENSNRGSFFRGWILLSICLGIFPPTERFIKYLQSFLRFGPVGYAPYCAERLRRTVANGVRGEPPSWLELQATKSKKPIAISVTLMDGRTISMPVDSASTSKEVCQMLSQKVKLQDTFGFSIYVALYDKVWSLGSGREHVMDAISQCEQEVKRKGGQEQHAPWRLYFRKEVFAPWHDCGQDNVSTDLIYRQVIRGLKYGEYQCEKEEDYVGLAAKHFYVQHGSDISMENTKTVVRECINSKLLEAKSEDKWTQMVNTAHAQGPFINSRTKSDKVKAEVVDFARQKWPMFFSKFFEVAKLSGPPLPKSKFILAINSTGITFLDEREKNLLVLSYPELTGVNTIRERKCVCLLTLKGDFTLNAIMAVEISDLVAMFLAGLIQRSQYAVALQEVNRQDDRTILSFKKAELIYLIKDEEFSAARGWLKGKNERTGEIGAIPADAVLILPTLTKPTNEVLSLISLSPDQRKTIIDNTSKGTLTERVAPSTLKEFSVEYFRPPIKDVNRQVISKNATPERLWANSREPIRQPLLKRLVGNPDLSPQACQVFTAILKYMGDYPTRQVQSPLELTDQIFGPPTQNEELRDEIYCQIMKQMTSNNNRYSIEQGWQLLWLCCGLFPPSNSLMKHAQRFIETRKREPLATDCLQRLQGARRMDPRKLPPHQVEVDAIQQNSTQIFHKIYFPNDSQEIFEVATNTKIRDLVRTIANKLMLSTAEGFSLFMKTPDKVLSLNETDYFFDSLRQITDWSKRAKRVNQAGAPVNVSYTVFFMRKLWFNIIPGRDVEADLIFHYPQELPKYLRGYHRCTKEEMVMLGALLFRVKVNNDKTQFPMIPKMLKDLVPNDQLKALSADEWKRSIFAEYNKQTGMTVEEAMIGFLKIVYKWPTFGCAFFDVKQTSEPNFPDIVRMAISKQGITIMNPKTKDPLAIHPYNKIANWCSGSTYFHMTVGNLVKGNKILCETSLGYKMDDLLTSYVNMYLNERRGQRRNHTFD
ncbi:unconventional myosin-VIIa isoform X1 [Danio aesculapii]|uniref:unconventional myosin-VIIa isoform X1 n=1 Tax=Danio aesculapii TaxID=1142201 RepID=UPI0024C08C35|nr:unconventional myosin-VIIa isoform X1 [Danio aesculapii]